MKHTIKEWMVTMRPWSFPASVIPVLVTIAYAAWVSSLYGSPVNWVNGLLAIVGIIFFHGAGNVISDYYDYKSGVDTRENTEQLPLVNGSFQPAEYKRLGYILLTIGIVIGLVLVYRTGWPLLVIGGVGAIFALMYSTFKYHAMGDLIILANFALLPILGTSYVVLGGIYYAPLVLTLPIALITIGILHFNNTRDIPTDREAGIHTFAMLLGEKNSVKLYYVEILLPYLLILVTILCHWLPWWSLLVFLSLPVAIKCVRTMYKGGKEGMQAAGALDQATAQLQLIFGLLLTISLFIGIWL